MIQMSAKENAKQIQNATSLFCTKEDGGRAAGSKPKRTEVQICQLRKQLLDPNIVQQFQFVQKMSSTAGKRYSKIEDSGFGTDAKKGKGKNHVKVNCETVPEIIFYNSLHSSIVL